jgi:hypothetical protein
VGFAAKHSGPPSLIALSLLVFRPLPKARPAQLVELGAEQVRQAMASAACLLFEVESMKQPSSSIKRKVIHMSACNTFQQPGEPSARQAAACHRSLVSRSFVRSATQVLQ